MNISDWMERLLGLLRARADLVSAMVIDLAWEVFGITFGGLGILQPSNTRSKMTPDNNKKANKPLHPTADNAPV
jgi:hypothetical protein